jgi:NAD(P)-dependent dehydrogenase (short-subunit alcohol dehydrogenase family)
MATWFITGASRGFGLLVVKEALSRGDNVVASARSAQRIIDTLSNGSERLLAVSVDVTERKSIDSAVAAAVDRFGRSRNRPSGTTEQCSTSTFSA